MTEREEFEQWCETHDLPNSTAMYEAWQDVCSTAPTTGSAPVAIPPIFYNGDTKRDPALRDACDEQVRASPAASVLHPSIARAIAQEERACRAEDALIDLVNQIKKSNPVDDHGHDFKMNMAYLEAVKLLDAVALLAASTGGDKA